MDIHETDPIMSDQLHKCARYEEAIFHAVQVMEEVAKATTDQESFKQLTIGYHKLRELLGIKELTDEKEN